MLIGDRISQITQKLGIPECQGCKQRKAFLNDLHTKLSTIFSGSTLPNRDGGTPPERDTEDPETGALEHYPGINEQP